MRNVSANNAFIGHGGQTKDLDGDEGDGYDEVIYPLDFKEQGHIVDDEVHEIVVKPLSPGVRLTAIFDSCHSGSMLDLPYIYSTKGVLKEPNLAKEAGQGLLSAVMSYARGDMGGVASSFMSFAKSAISGDKAHEKTIRTKTSPADVILWSGSKDDQTSADATIASKATGAMSYAFITALRQNPDQSYLELLNNIRDILETKYTQKPQLSCSHPLGEPPSRSFGNTCPQQELVTNGPPDRCQPGIYHVRRAGMPRRGLHRQCVMYLFREGGRVLLPSRATCIRTSLFWKNGSGMGSYTNQSDLDEHAVTNVLNRRYCLIGPYGQYCYGDPAVIPLLHAQLSRPHIASLA